VGGLGCGLVGVGGDGGVVHSFSPNRGGKATKANHTTPSPLPYHTHTTGRIKAPYSVWKKTKARNCSVDDLYDMIALRVVVTPLPDSPPTTPSTPTDPTTTHDAAIAERRAATGKALCEYVLSLVHKTRPHVPGRVKDYISAPKANGYQSLHTTLAMRLRGKGYPVEVQVRTAEMHAIAEHGLAAHSLYKVGGVGGGLVVVLRLIIHYDCPLRPRALAPPP
jgi:(p)ppGpp synthase/HD superfamily hydrolase